MSERQRSQRSPDDLPCFDCDKPTIDTDYYMVTMAVWTQAGMTPTHVVLPEPESELLCIACLEKRLGRELVRADFVDVPLNVHADRCDTLLSQRLQPDGTNVGLSPIDWR